MNFPQPHILSYQATSSPIFSTLAAFVILDPYLNSPLQLITLGACTVLFLYLSPLPLFPIPLEPYLTIKPVPK
jgi:hypothetical protein